MIVSLTKIKDRSDVSDIAVKHLTNIGGCAGTYHKIKSKDSHDRTLPCIGHGLLMSEYTTSDAQTHHEKERDELLGLQQSSVLTGNQKMRLEFLQEAIRIQNLELKKFTEDMGVKYTDPEPFITAETVVECPCLKDKQDVEKYGWIAEKLGATPKVMKPYPLQLAVREHFKGGANLFLHGIHDSGKTYAAYLCAREYEKKIHVYVDHQLKNYFTEVAKGDERADFKGLLIFDNAHNIEPTANYAEKLLHVLGRVKDKQLRMIITSSLSPKDFMQKFCVGKGGMYSEQDRPMWENRMGKFEYLKMTPE